MCVLGNEATLDFLLTTTETKVGLISQMDTIRQLYNGGNTNTTGGLRVMREQVKYRTRLFIYVLTINSQSLTILHLSGSIWNEQQNQGVK